MKNFAVILAIAATLLNSCGTQRLSTSVDDVYVNPGEEKKKQELLAAEKSKQEALARQKAEEDRAAEKERIASNAYYKEPEYNSDDYYDYEYASRLNRFYNPIGVGYYDNYYTNMYTYNQNPAYYGTSIYSSVGHGMPSGNYGTVGFGLSYGYGSGWGRSPYAPYYDPWYTPYGYGLAYPSYYGGYGYPYNSYMNGYYAGYNAGYYSGMNAGYWPYYNSCDVNSGYSRVDVGPRLSNAGSSNPGRVGSGEKIREAPTYQNTYFENVSEQQKSSPRFNTNSDSRIRNSTNTGTRIDGQRRVDSPAPSNDQRARESDRNRNNDRIVPKQAEPARNDNTQRRAEPAQNNPAPGSTAPRNSGGSGTIRPR